MCVSVAVGALVEASKTSSGVTSHEVEPAVSSPAQAATAAAPAVSSAPLKLGVTTLFPLTQTVEEILAGHPATTSPGLSLPSGNLGSTLGYSANASPRPECLRPGRRRGWQEAAGFAASRSKVLQQLRHEQSLRGQPPGHSQSNTVMNTTGSIKSDVGVHIASGGRILERAPAPQPVTNVMSGRLLRAQKQAKAKWCDAKVTSMAGATRIRNTDQGHTFQESLKGGKTSQYASDLFGSTSKKTLGAAAPAVQAPDWAIAAVKKA
jgi:hypothetical protein